MSETNLSKTSRGLLSTGDGIALAGAVIGLILGLGQCSSASRSAELQQQQNAVKIAFGVLSQKAPRDKEGNAEKFPDDEQALRKWAVSALNESSGDKVSKITGKAEKALVEGRAALSRDSGYSDYGYDDFRLLKNTDGAVLKNTDGTPLMTGGSITDEKKSGQK